MFTRDLAAILLFLSVYLHTHSTTLCPRTPHTHSTQETQEAVNSLFVSLADIFHCWSSSQIFKREFRTAIFTHAENSHQFQYFRQFSTSVGAQTQLPTQSKKLPNLLLVCLELLLPLNDQMLSPEDRLMVGMVKERVGKVRPHTHITHHTLRPHTHIHYAHTHTHTHTHIIHYAHTHTSYITPTHTHRTQKKVIAEDLKEEIVQELETVHHSPPPPHTHTLPPLPLPPHTHSTPLSLSLPLPPPAPPPPLPHALTLPTLPPPHTHHRERARVSPWLNNSSESSPRCSLTLLRPVLRNGPSGYSA